MSAERKNDDLDRATELVLEGMRYQREKNFNAARLHYDAALLLNPEHPVALHNLSGIMLAHQKNHAALNLARRGLVASPGNAGLLSNHAAALGQLNLLAQAEAETRQALKSIPDGDGTWHNLSLILYQTGQIGAAIDAIERAIEIYKAKNVPIPIAALGDYAIYTLASGDIQRGLEFYECRWKTLFRSKVWNLKTPEWQGEELSGKKLLLHHEQGFGDGIMLCRFIGDLQNLGAKVDVAVPGELVRLIAKNFDCRVINWEDEETLAEVDYDFHSPMLSALRWLKIEQNSINPAPYLTAEEWTGSLGPSGDLRVGICWESGDHSPLLKHRRRVIPLEMFFPLTEHPGIRLVSLQKGQKDILSLGAESFIFDPMGRVEDFYDTARIIRSLDLVISVDSAVAHLAGALGTPVFMLRQYTRCWRWWGGDRGLPWYRDFKIFSQEKPEAWIAPMKRIHAMLNWRLAPK